MEVPPTPILLLTRALESGGSERQLTEIAKALDPNRWLPHAGCFHDSGIRAAELRSENVPVVRFPVRSFRSASTLSSLIEFRRYVRQHRIGLVHSFDPPMNIFGVPAAWMSGCPIVVSSQRCYRTLLTPVERRLLRVTDRLVKAVVVNCEALRRHLIEDENVAPDTVHVCYNGLDTRSFRPDGKSIPASLVGADLVIGTLCVLRPEKGLDTLLRAFSSLRSRHPGARLLIVGSGPMLEPMRNVCKELGITEQTVFQPATADVPYWIRAMDVFVLPSLSEALSNSLMEAMACGVASIASEVGGSPELIRNGETGFLFRAGDVANLSAQLERLASDAELRRRIAAAGSEFIIENFSIKAAVQRFDDLYVQLRDATSQ